MKRFVSCLSLGVLSAWLSWAPLSQAAGLLTPVNAQLPTPTIESHEVDVVIQDGYAITTVDQVFRNDSTQDLEAIYTFPVPENGTVSNLTLWIDGQPVHGEVFEKKQARQLYETEKQAGRETALTEQDRHVAFDTHVSPVRAQQQTRVQLQYMQPLAVDHGVGRYVYPLEEGGVDEARQAFWQRDETVQHFRFNLSVRSGWPIDGLRLPQHPQATIQQVSEGEWTVEIDNRPVPVASGIEEEAGGTTTPVTPNAQQPVRLDQDVVVYWRHQAGLPGALELVAHKKPDAQKGTFMLVLSPGDDFVPLQQQGRDWVFVLDISGSMQGKYATLVEGVRQALGKMSGLDRFQIVLFNDRAQSLTPGFVSATEDQVRQYIDQLDRVAPNSGTNLHGGLDLGLKQLDADRTSSIVLVTDGEANVGLTEQKDFIELLNQKDVRLFTMVMGNGANRPLLQAMTRHSGGFAMNVSNSDDILGHLLSATSKVTHAALHGVQVEIDGVRTTDLQPQSIGSLYRGQQLVLFGHYWQGGAATVSVRGTIAGQEKVYRSEIELPTIAEGNPHIERLWAYAAIQAQMQHMQDFGEDADRRQSVVDLAREYGLVTDYTSMLVMREESFQANQVERRNQQRVAQEQQQQAERAQAAVPSRTVDTYAQPRPQPGSSAGGGSGSVGRWWLLALVVLLGLALWRRGPGD